MPPTSPRPLKRARIKVPEDTAAPFDHVFIADGVHAKKPGKKVHTWRSLLRIRDRLIVIVCSRLLYPVVNVAGKSLVKWQCSRLTEALRGSRLKLKVPIITPLQPFVLTQKI